MTSNEKYLCTICARGGSKNVPGKNIRMIAGKPLISYSIEQALQSNIFDAIAVSSDDDAILDIASSYNIHIIKRPSNLASDKAGKIPAIHHALSYMEHMSGYHYDILVDLDVTAPLREVDDIHNVVAMLHTRKVHNIITGVKARRSPYFNMVEITNNKAHLSKHLDNAIIRRQDSPQCYDMNASIYAWHAPSFKVNPQLFYDDTMLYMMSEETAFDIDNQLDLDIVTMLLHKKTCVKDK